VLFAVAVSPFHACRRTEHLLIQDPAEQVHWELAAREARGFGDCQRSHVNTRHASVVLSGMGSVVAGFLSVVVGVALLPASGTAQPTGYPRGVLIDPVVSPSDPTQRYVLYVPTTLDPAKPAPVLFIMDYRGRARVAAERFQAAAERLGWIVASSYNTASDGDGGPNVVAVKTMWRDVHEAFAIDDERMYLAGLSGTARMATLIAERSGVRFRGVIGAAAGFHPDVPPSKKTPFVYYGTAGTVDYNYWEMRGLEERLTRFGVPHRIAFFEGRHGWMPPELAEAALMWMELRAMQAGARGIDRKLVEERWSRDMDRAEGLEHDGRQWQASKLMAAMAADYAGLRPKDKDADEDEVSRIARRAAELGATQQALSQAKMQERAAREHDRHVEQALQVVAAAFPPRSSEPRATLAATILNLNVVRLRRAAATASEAGLSAARVLAELNVQTGFYLPVAAMRAGDDERAKYYLGIAHAIDPEDGYAWYLRAAISARMGQPQAAIDALDKAVSFGFRTVDAVEHDRSFTALRGRPDFIAVVRRMRDSTD
jgi:poly(3-hydroxybutyrate) depolymerase